MSVFHKNQLVWAKIKGYPWWPASVAKSNEGKNGVIDKEVIVNFIGENSHASVSIDKVVDFKDKYDEFVTQKNKRLQESIKIALKIQSGLTTFDAEERAKTDIKAPRGKSYAESSDDEEIPPKLKKSKKQTTNQPKKQRGRKKALVKSKDQPDNQKEEKDDKSSRANIDKEITDSSALPVVTKGRRGRKPKNATPQPTPTVTETKNEAPKVPRPRGRQPKAKPVVEENKEASDTESIQELNEAATNKKGAGRKLPTTKINSKRLNSSRGNQENNPIYGGKNEGKDSSEEVITKKKKLNSDEDRFARFTKGQNTQLIKKLENDLEEVLSVLSKRFKNREKLRDDDPELAKLFGSISDFENNTFIGSEFITSEVGKLVKTIYVMLSKCRDLLGKQGEFALGKLNAIVNNIKIRIAKFCLDISEYLEIYNFEPDQTANMHIEQPNNQKMETENVQSPLKHEEERSESGGQVNGGQAVGKSSNQMVEESPTRKEDTNALFVRKKVCQKLARLIQSSYNMEKDKSQNLTLVIEGKVHSFYPSSLNEYKSAIKALYKLIKAQHLNIHELTGIPEMDYKRFIELVTTRLQKLNTSLTEIKEKDKESLYDSHVKEPNGEKKEIKVEAVPLRKQDSVASDFSIDRRESEPIDDKGNERANQMA